MNEHSHSDCNPPPKDNRFLIMALAITLSFFFIELVGGLLTNSLALQTDAWHMLNDVIALSFTLLAARIALRPATMRRTFGFHRTEIIAAFLNAIFLGVIVIFIIWEAISRIQNPSEVKSLQMLVIAFSGLVANLMCALILSRSNSGSLNIKGAYLHVMADALGSVGAIIGGIIMFITGWFIADPIVSILIGGLILYTSGKLMRDSLNVLLEGVPPHIDMTDLERSITMQKGVKDLHDLHVWCITPNKHCCMSCHVTVEKGTNTRKLLKNMIEILKTEFKIDHPTIQFEDGDFPKAAGEH